MGWPGRSLWLPLLLAAAHVANAQQVDALSIEGVADGNSLFLSALALARSGRADSSEDLPELRSHPLYAYLLAERIEAQLAAAGDASTSADELAEAFIESHRGEPVAWGLRYEWLVSLARRERWQTFLDAYDVDFADDTLRCQYLAARIELGQIEGIAPLIVDQWLTSRQLPVACEPVFEWLRDEGALTDDHIRQRLRLLLENGRTGFARIIARRLPPEQSAPFLRWADLIDRPAAELSRYIEAPAEEIEPEILLDAWSRLARDAPDTALEMYASLMARLDPAKVRSSDYVLAMAYGLAWDRRRESLDFFAIVPPGELDDYALTWRTRAALWADDWALAAQSIADMSEAQRASATWRYWAARATELQHGRRSAEPLYEALLRDDNFYSGLSAARLRRRLQPNLEALPRDAPTVSALASQSTFVRARELMAIGLPVAAMREWRYGFSQLDTERQRQSIHLAADWRWYDLAVATATRFGIFNDYSLLYPRPYPGEVVAAARATRVAPALIYGVMRQESLFRSDAVSAAGARGLMQLKPGTAAQIGRRLDASLPDDADLLDPAVNILLGSAELDRLVAEFDGSVPVALAAYNAGPRAAERWLPESAMDADVWIENIPFNETRLYVQRVLWHTLVFRWLESRRPQDTREWLEKVSR